MSYIHTFMSSTKPSFCPSSVITDFRDGNSLVLLVGDPLKLIGLSALRAVAKPELMQLICRGEKLLLSSPGNKWLIREEPEGIHDC